MKAENTTRIQFDSLSVNEGFARGAVAAFLARYDPTVPQMADIKTAVSEAVTNCIVHAYPDRVGQITLTVSVYHHRQPRGTLGPGLCGDAELYGRGAGVLRTGPRHPRHPDQAPGRQRGGYIIQKGGHGNGIGQDPAQRIH